LPFYAINADIVDLFAYSSILFLSTLNLYCIFFLGKRKIILIKKKEIQGLVALDLNHV
jgi:hypothetical protein